MSLRSAFKTSSDLERQGIEIDYGDAVIRVRRAGGSNKAYNKAVTKALRPYQSAIDAGTVGDDVLLPLLIKPFVEHVIVSWHTRQDGELHPGLEREDGSIVDYTTDGACALLLELPELYRDLQKQAADRKLFLEDVEAAAGN